METWVKQSLFAAGVTVAVTVGLVWYEKSAMASAAGAGAAPATQAMQTLSLSGTKSIQIAAPTGGVPTSATSQNPAVATVSSYQTQAQSGSAGRVATAAGAGWTITAVAVGQSAIQLAWTDASGAAQTTTVPITVTA